MLFKSASVLLFVSSLGLFNVASATSIEQGVSFLKAGNTEQAIKQFKKLQGNPEASLYLAQIYMQSDLDESQEWIEEAIAQQPNAAIAHFWRGRIMAAQAQNAIFSALSYAGQSLDGFTQAVALEPDSIPYRMGLMQFHLQAPSIAGGDLKIAQLQVEKIKQLDALAGTKAEIDLAFAQDKESQAELLLSEAKQNYSHLPDFFFIAGMRYQRQENYVKAFEQLSLAANKPAETEESTRAKYNAMYQLGRTAVLTENNLALGIQSLQNYLKQAPDLDNMSPKSWAEFRLANLLALNSQQSEAKLIYLRLSKTADKNLAKQAKKAARKI